MDAPPLSGDDNERAMGRPGSTGAAGRSSPMSIVFYRVGVDFAPHRHVSEWMARCREHPSFAAVR
jgi:hypothetical protein